MSTIVDLVVEIRQRDKWSNLAAALHGATGRQLWEWQRAALVFELSEDCSSSRTMAKALVGMIGCEATRRLGPRSIDNPNGFLEENEEAERGTRPTQTTLPMGGAVA